MNCKNEIDIYIDLFISNAQSIAATMQGTGSVEATMKRAAKLAAEFQGIGSVDAQMKVAQRVSSTLLAEGNTSAALVVASVLQSTLQGTGSAEAALKVAALLQSTMQGTASVSASAVAAAKMSGTLSGVGVLDATVSGLPEAEYQSVITQATANGYTLPSVAQQALQNQLIIDLKASGVWGKLDVFYVFANDGSPEFSTINWINPAHHQASLVNSPAFISNQGFQGDGVASYIDLNYNGATQRVNYADNSAHMMVWLSTIGSMEIATSDILVIRSSIRQYASSNIGINSSNSASGTVSYTAGMLAVSRNSPMGYNQILNGATIATPLQAQNTSGGAAMVLRNWFSYGDCTAAFSSLGSDISDVALDYYNALNNYMTAL